MNKLTMKATKRILCLLLCLLCLLAAVPLSAIAEGEESPAHIETCVEGCTGEDCTCTCHTAAEPAAHIETCVEGCTGEDCACTCHTAAEPAAHIETCVEGCTGEGCTCTCHAATVTEQDNKEQDEQGEQSALFGALLSCTTCEEMHTILDNADVTAVEALTYDELTALIEHVGTLTDDDAAKEELIYDLTVLRDGEVMDLKPGQGGGGSSSSGGDIDESKYNKTIPVYWDTVTALSQSGTSATNDNVTLVKLNNTNVTNGVATNTSWSGGTTLATYFPSASANNMQDATLSITAAEGFYVTGVVVACAPTGGSRLKPFNCSTWSSGKEYIQTFNLTSSTYSDGKYTLSFSINSKYFSHNGATPPNAYFILITVAAVPTPLYVEYNYGNVTDFLTVDSDSAFYTPTWTVKNISNSYGSGEKYEGGVLTDGTQFAYQYSNNNTSELANWKHYANTISANALAEAAAVGYYFTGWTATYYNKCTVTKSTNTYGDSYTMNFSDEYLKNGSYSQGDFVTLPTNVRLVAQWAPIQLKMTKTVTGLSSIEEFKNSGKTYKLTLQKQNANGTYSDVDAATEVEYTITGDNFLTYTFAATGADKQYTVTPGTYKVVETNADGTLQGTNNYAYCTTTYPVETITVNSDGTFVDNSNELKVLNTYSSTPATYDLTVKKTVSGNMFSDTKEFAFTVNYTDANGKAQTKTFNLEKDGTYKIEGIKVGEQVTVTENPDGYTFSVDTENTTVTGTTDNEKYSFTFTMPSQNTTVVFNNNLDAKIETGIILDALPYVLILAIVAGGVVLMLLRRRRSYED